MILLVFLPFRVLICELNSQPTSRIPLAIVLVRYIRRQLTRRRRRQNVCAVVLASSFLRGSLLCGGIIPLTLQKR